MTSYELPAEDRKLEVTESGPDQITVQFDGLEIQLWRSKLEADEGQPVVQIDGAGIFRVNVNDYPIWNADPDGHEHRECLCVTDVEEDDDPADAEPPGMSRIEEEHDYKFGEWRL